MDSAEVATLSDVGEQVTASAHTRVLGARAAAPAVQDDLILGRYRLGKRLGGGGFGVVHSARDERLDRDVAIKVLPLERIVGGRFEREARAAARLSHPHIVTLYEAAIDDEGAYLVSELVRGRTLAQLFDSGRLSDRDVLRISAVICEALLYAHEQGVIHRDVKPSNILVPSRSSPLGAGAKLTDFGVARLVGGDSLTRTGEVLGTAAYMAPEQAAGRDTGPPADLYALALVTYEALTGVNPLRDLAGAAHVRRLGVYLPPLRRQRRDLPRALGIALDQALRPRPGERGSLEELRYALEAAQDEAGQETGIIAAPRRLLRSPAEDPEKQRPDPAVWEARRPGVGDRAAGLCAGGTAGRARARSSAGPGRAVGCAAAAALAAWFSARALQGDPLPPASAGVLAGLATLLLPRIGFSAVIAFLSAAAAIEGHPGAALLLACATLLSAGVLAFSGVAWATPAAAGVLAVLGVSGAWPAIAGRLGARAWQRAALGATGFIWIAAADPLARHLFTTHPALGGAGAWEGSLSATVQMALIPVLRSGVVAGAATSACAAALLPVLTRSSQPRAQLMGLLLWSALTLGALAAWGPPDLTGLLAGIVLAAALLSWQGVRAAVRERGAPARAARHTPVA